MFHGEVNKHFRRVWNEKVLKLELHGNKAKRFLLCFFVCIDDKKVFLLFSPRRKCFPTGIENPYLQCN